MNYMMCLGMVMRIFWGRGWARARGTLAAADRYRFDQKFLRWGCGGERTSARAFCDRRSRMVAVSARCCTCPDAQSAAHCR